MQERDGIITVDLNCRETAHRYEQLPNHAASKNRALDMDHAIQMAFQDSLIIRVIVCDGKMRDRDDPNAEASHVSKRLLDEVNWAVTMYDSITGKCTLTRGAKQGKKPGDTENTG